MPLIVRIFFLCILANGEEAIAKAKTAKALANVGEVKTENPDLYLFELLKLSH